MIRIIEGTETQVVETVQFPSIVGAEIEYGTVLKVQLPLKRAKALMNLLFNETSLKKLIRVLMTTTVLLSIKQISIF